MNIKIYSFFIVFTSFICYDEKIIFQNSHLVFFFRSQIDIPYVITFPFSVFLSFPTHYYSDLASRIILSRLPLFSSHTHFYRDLASRIIFIVRSFFSSHTHFYRDLASRIIFIVRSFFSSTTHDERSLTSRIILSECLDITNVDITHDAINIQL
ncbi:hypothetical protein ES703_57490 [subsurface metagenome]